MKQRKTPKPWNISEDSKSLMQNLAGESERVRVIIASTFLENGLECCLRWKFRNEMTKTNNKTEDDDKFIDKLFNTTFRYLGPKASMARAIGIVDQTAYEAIDSVRQIRNRCAHSNFKIHLSDSSVSTYIERLKNYLLQECGDCEHSDWEKEITARFKKLGVAIRDESDLCFSLAVVHLFGCLAIAEFHLTTSARETQGA